MSCLEPIPEIQTIVQGEDKALNVRLINADAGDPFDLTLATEILAIFPSTDSGLFFEKRLSRNQITLASAPGGRMIVALTPTDTNLLPVGTAVSFEVRVTINSLLTTVQCLNALTVVASLFPTA